MSNRASVGRGSRVAGRGYQQLGAWQRAHELSLVVFRVTESLRKHHRWLADQFVRSAVSVAANIAEGYNRGSLREYIQFLNIARGSLSETEYYVIFAQDTGLLAPLQAQELGKLISEAGSLLLGLLRSLQLKEGGRSTRIIRDQTAPYVDALGLDAHDPRPSTLDPRPSARPRRA